LPDREQRFLRTRVIRAIIISAESHESVKFEIFERLNTGSVALNAQEIRNSIYRGTLNDFLKELEEESSFRTCIGSRTPRRRLVDRELVLRFLALRERLASYRPPLLRFLNSYMADNQSPPDEFLQEHRSIFSEPPKRSPKCLVTRHFVLQIFRVSRLNQR
jgi:hypothetical protein